LKKALEVQNAKYYGNYKWKYTRIWEKI
jgi:hypothetical protein